MKTAHRIASRAKHAQLPKFWRPNLEPSRQLDAKLIHWDLVDRFTSGTATVVDLWDWIETGFTYSQIMRLLDKDGLIDMDRHGIAVKAAQWSIDQMAKIRREVS